MTFGFRPVCGTSALIMAVFAISPARLTARFMAGPALAEAACNILLNRLKPDASTLMERGILLPLSRVASSVLNRPASDTYMQGGPGFAVARRPLRGALRLAHEGVREDYREFPVARKPSPRGSIESPVSKSLGNRCPYRSNFLREKRDDRG